MVIARSRIRGRAARRATSQEVAPQQRLAARQPHLVDAEVEEHIDEPLDLLELQDVLTRTSWLSKQRHILFHLTIYFGTLAGGLGCFPLDYGSYHSQSDSQV